MCPLWNSLPPDSYFWCAATGEATESSRGRAGVMPMGGRALFRAGDAHGCLFSVLSKMTSPCPENLRCLPQTLSAWRSGSLPEKHGHNTRKCRLLHHRLFWVRSGGSSHHSAWVRTNLLDEAELGLGHVTARDNRGISWTLWDNQQIPVPGF